MVAYSLIASSIEWGYYYLSFVLCILLLSIALSGFVAFKIINNKIKKGMIRQKDVSKPTVTSTIGTVSVGIGVVIARVLPEKATPILIVPILGILVGAICATTLTIYYYGKKYDPDCELIKDIQPELEENNAVS